MYQDRSSNVKMFKGFTKKESQHFWLLCSINVDEWEKVVLFVFGVLNTRDGFFCRSLPTRPTRLRIPLSGFSATVRILLIIAPRLHFTLFFELTVSEDC